MKCCIYFYRLYDFACEVTDGRLELKSKTLLVQQLVIDEEMPLK